jgi:hypothetical protein
MEESLDKASLTNIGGLVFRRSLASTLGYTGRLGSFALAIGKQSVTGYPLDLVLRPQEFKLAFTVSMAFFFERRSYKDLKGQTTCLSHFPPVNV